MATSQRVLSFRVVWAALIVSTLVLGLISPFTGLNAVGRIIGWEPATEDATYASMVLDGAILALPIGLLALGILSRQRKIRSLRRKLATVGAFVFAGALVTLSLLAIMLGWFSLVTHVLAVLTGTIAFHPTSVYISFCSLGPLAIAFVCVLLAKIPSRII